MRRVVTPLRLFSRKVFKKYNLALDFAIFFCQITTPGAGPGGSVASLLIIAAVSRDALPAGLFG